MPLIAALKGWARAIKRDVVALWLAARDPRVPWHAKVAAGAVAAYALSPINLIPDFIPVLGLLDDIIIVPLGILLVVRLIPAALMDELRQQAAREESRRLCRTRGHRRGMDRLPRGAGVVGRGEVRPIARFRGADALTGGGFPPMSPANCAGALDAAFCLTGVRR